MRQAADSGDLIGSPFSLGRRPELDGLRAIAVIVVMLLHAGLPIAWGGVGVDVFFVLSGFLITALLIEEVREGGRVKLSHFYARRAIRLMPPLLVALAGATLLWAVASAPRRPLIAREIVWTALYVMNLARAAGAEQTMLLGHTWSLATEEQFYLVAPLVFVLLVSRGRPLASSLKRLACLMTVGIVAVTAWRVRLALNGASSARVYNGPDTRCDGLMAGCLIAVCAEAGWLQFTRNDVRPPGSTTWRWRLAACASILVLIVVFRLTEGRAQVGLFLWLPAASTCGAMLTGYLLCGPQSWDARVLATRPLRGIGRMSYGLYLYHFPIMNVVGLAKFPLIVHAPLTLLLSFTAAFLSWHFIEVPTSRLRRFVQGNRTRDHRDGLGFSARSSDDSTPRLDARVQT